MHSATENSHCKLLDNTFLCHIIISTNHVIIDGSTMVELVGIFLRLIEDVLYGNKIDDTIQTSKLIDPTVAEAARIKIERKFTSSPQLAYERIRMYQSSFAETLIEKAYPVSPNKKLSSEWLPNVFDRLTTQKFTKKCKNNGISFHSGYCSVINMSIIKLLLDKEVFQNAYDISSMHCVDLRQYFGIGSGVFGLFCGEFDLPIATPSDVAKNFWKFASSYNDMLKKQVRTNACFEYEIASTVTGINPVQYIDEKRPHDKMAYYGATNMKDATALIGNKSDKVELQYITRTTSMYRYPVLWTHSFQTFKGCLLDSIHYRIDR